MSGSLVSDIRSIKHGLKEWIPVRYLCKPFVEHMEARLQKEYLLTEYPRRIQALKGIHTGERCFVIGNGPSLRAEDLTLLIDEKTFGANRIYEMFDKTPWRPTYYMSVDRDFVADNYDMIRSLPMEPLFLRYSEIRRKDVPKQVIGVNLGQRYLVKYWDPPPVSVSEDVSTVIAEGSTVTFAAIQMAIYMGFKEIYLLGVDFNYSTVRDRTGKVHVDPSVQDYFSGRKYKMGSVFNYQANLNAYQAAKVYCDAHGITIKNATRGGKLEVFDRIALENVVGGGNF